MIQDNYRNISIVGAGAWGTALAGSNESARSSKLIYGQKKAQL